MSGTNLDDFDPAAVPISHAATVMLLDDRPDLHVLMVHRTARVIFAPDMWVFPGGRVDPDDHLDDFDVLCRGLTDQQASAFMEIERGGLAWWIAAARETLEEAGLLLAADTTDANTIAEIRKLVLEDENLFADVLLQRGITLDVTPIEEVARFITPLGSPRRFDARFFVARAPVDQDPSHDEGEIVNCRWMRPQDALDQWAAGSMEMMSPTVRMVACLARFRSADEVLTVAKQRLPYKRIRVDGPDLSRRLLLPGEDGYDDGNPDIELGWVRFWEHDQT